MAVSTPDVTTPAVLGSLAESDECLFSCGGTIQVKNIVLFYKKQSGDWSSKPLELHEGLTENVQEFVESCSTTSSGIASKAVSDRRALKLESECFCVNFEIATTYVLDHISRIMSSTPVRAELYMLNVYSTGGYFKSDFDTPRSADLFGSLVVCFPTQFTGGALVTQHCGRQVTFDWSSSTASSSTAIPQWAAFYSGVEHEVLPVTSGHRITLTYNLYRTSPGVTPASSLNVTINPLYQEFKAALQSPHFMKQGGTLGFFCQHKYTDISTDLHKFSPFLKGEDALVYEIATSLELPISLKPVAVFSSAKHDYYSSDKFIIPEFGSKQICLCEDHEKAEEMDEVQFDFMKEHFGESVLEGENIAWCQDPKIFEAVVGLFEYEEQCQDKHVGCEIHQAAAFLIVVPEFTNQRGSV